MATHDGRLVSPKHLYVSRDDRGVIDDIQSLLSRCSHHSRDQAYHGTK